jgi:hypothetical protein
MVDSRDYRLCFPKQDQWLVIHGRPPPLRFHPLDAESASRRFVLLHTRNPVSDDARR